MVYGSVCSGIEAASVAWHTLGWKPAWFCEIEPFPSAVLKERYPHVQNYGDFTRLSEPDHPVRSTPIDVLVGGTPCQAFSVAGLREGMRDPRGGLTLEYVRLARALRPKWLVWENVPGVLSSGQGRDFGAFVGALVESGYGVAWRVLDAQYVRVDGYPHAVPQRRKRVFVVGHSGGDAARAASVLFEPEGVRRDSAPRRASRKGVAYDAARGSAERQWPSDVACTLAACFGEKLELEDQHALGGASLFVPEARFWNGADVAESLTCTSDDQRMPDKNRMQMVVHAAAVTATPAYDSCPTLTSRMQGSSRWAPYNEDAHLVSHAAVVQPAVHFDVYNHKTTGDVCGVVREQHGTNMNAVLQPVAFTFDDGQSENPKATHQFSLEHSSPLIKARPLCTGVTTMSVREMVVPIDLRQASRGDKNTNDRTNGGAPGTGIGEAGDPAYTLSERQQAVHAATMSVRRLTPTECERLQGFPDGWTQIPWKGKPASECPDGPRYKALGNSMACNVMRWIGARIQAVEEA